MSSSYVRETVRDWLANTPGMVLPFFDTVNREVPRKDPNPWATVDFISNSVQRVTYCGGMQESGTFDYVALGPPGVGDLTLLRAAEADVALLLTQLDPSGALTLLHASAPDDFLQAGSTPYYTVSMVIEYLYFQPQRGTKP